MLGGISLSTGYRNAAADHPEVSRGKLKLDRCDDCRNWDNSVSVVVMNAMKQIKADLVKL